MNAWRQIEAGIRLQDGGPDLPGHLFPRVLGAALQRTQTFEGHPVTPERWPIAGLDVAAQHPPHPEVAQYRLYCYENVPNLRLWTGARHLLMMELKDQ